MKQKLLQFHFGEAGMDKSLNLEDNSGSRGCSSDCGSLRIPAAAGLLRGLLHFPFNIPWIKHLLPPGRCHQHCRPLSVSWAGTEALGAPLSLLCFGLCLLSDPNHLRFRCPPSRAGRCLHLGFTAPFVTSSFVIPASLSCCYRFKSLKSQGFKV